jgi:spoIIIJ-associated protein
VPTPDDKDQELDSSFSFGEGEGGSTNGQQAAGEATADGGDAPAETQDDRPGGDRPETAAVYDEARAESARDFVEDLMVKMGMDVVADLLEPEPGDPAGEIRIEIEGRDSGRIIGKKGQVLAAIQHVVNRVVNRPGLDRVHVVVDAEGYRQRREDTLATMAQRLGKKALEEGKIITFEPMSPRDRRIVHLALAKFPGVVTKSDGEGEGRRVQIIPVRR